MEATFNKPISQLVNENYLTASVFEKYHIDYCCSGKRTLADACQKKELDTMAVMEDLEAVTNGNSYIQQRVELWSTPFLIDYIVSNHHQYIRINGPRIQDIIGKVAENHGDTQPETIRIAKLFSGLLAELYIHLDKEENDFFPVLASITKGEETRDTLSPGILEKTNKELEDEHETAGSIMHEIRKLSHDFTPPEGSCATCHIAYSELLAFERDLHRHVHLENNVLFTRFDGYFIE